MVAPRFTHRPFPFSPSPSAVAIAPRRPIVRPPASISATINHAEAVDAAVVPVHQALDGNRGGPGESPTVPEIGSASSAKEVHNAPGKKTLARRDRMEGSVVVVERHEPVPDFEIFYSRGACVLIDKPPGWTSFNVCSKFRAITGIKRIGHAGTLDPMATGLLVVLLGPATVLQDRYMAFTKCYSGSIRLGEATPSYDADTAVSDTRPWAHVTDDDVERVRQKFTGDVWQVPPMWSALKKDGVKLLHLALRGEEVPREARLIQVEEFELRRSPSDPQELLFRVQCSKGTYVRSLAHDLCLELGTVGHLTALRRESVGSMSVSDAWGLEEFQEATGQRPKVKAFKPPKIQARKKDSRIPLEAHERYTRLGLSESHLNVTREMDPVEGTAQGGAERLDLELTRG